MLLYILYLGCVHPEENDRLNSPNYLFPASSFFSDIIQLDPCCSLKLLVPGICFWNQRMIHIPGCNFLLIFSDSFIC